MAEVIIVLDGVAWPSGKIDDTRVRVVTSPGSGLSSALNSGIRVAVGDYIVRMDSDDICLPWRLNDTVRAIENSSADLIVAPIVKFGATVPLLEVPPSSRDLLLERLRHTGYAIAHPSVAIRKDVLLGAGGYRSEWDGVEDLDLWLRLLGCGEVSVARLRRPAILYRVHHEQTSHHASTGLARRRLLTEDRVSEACDRTCPGRLLTFDGVRDGDTSSFCVSMIPTLGFWACVRNLRRRNESVRCFTQLLSLTIRRIFGVAVHFTISRRYTKALGSSWR